MKAKKNKSGAAGKNVLDTERDSLAKELKGLISKLDSEGIAFLIEQARVHLYNMQVDELNRAAIAANAASARSHSLAAKTRGAGKAAAANDNMRIEGSESGSSYYLFYRNTNIMFSRDEMTQLVKIANGEGTDLEIRGRLYNWFDRERKDIFATVPIADKFDERLKKLVSLIKKNFKLKK